MIEVEVKARASKDMAEKIAALGATLSQVENHHDLYFNSPWHDFTVCAGALRIRIKEEGARLTYKGPKLDQETGSRLEWTVKIDDPVQMERIHLAGDSIQSSYLELLEEKKKSLEPRQ
jgi:adenylate cyclase class 2